MGPCTEGTYRDIFIYKILSQDVSILLCCIVLNSLESPSSARVARSGKSGIHFIASGRLGALDDALPLAINKCFCRW